MFYFIFHQLQFITYLFSFLIKQLKILLTSVFKIMVKEH